MKMNDRDKCMITHDLMDDTDGLNDESDIPLIEDIQESIDHHGKHIVITFDDGTKAHTHTHGILSEEYHDSTMRCLELTKKAMKWMKNNMWKNQQVDIGMMAQTSMMLGSVSKLLHTTATCISSDETERLAND